MKDKVKKGKPNPEKRKASLATKKAKPKPELKSKPKPVATSKPKPISKPQPQAKPSPLSKVLPKPQPKLPVKPQPQPLPKSQPKLPVKPQPQPLPKPQPKLPVKPQPQPLPKPQPKPQPKLPVKPQPQPLPKSQPKLPAPPQPKPLPKPAPKGKARIGIIIGSESDRYVMEDSARTLEDLGIRYEFTVSSAHRNPEQTRVYAREAARRGFQVIIAGAGGAAHLAGVLATETTLPVIAVPMDTSPLHGLDSFLSTFQMPSGVPVATMGIGRSGAKNAAILAAEILALSDSELEKRLREFKRKMSEGRRLAGETTRPDLPAGGGPRKP